MTELPPVDVSVVICVRNGGDSLRIQLDALAGQVDAPPFEVVISNNGSTDNTQQVAEEWARGDIGSVSVVQIVDSGAKPGIPHARNAGALAARGKLLAYCDADDAVHPGWVRAMADAVTEGMGAGRVHGHQWDGTPLPDAFPDSLLPTVYLPHAPGCNFAILREAFFDIGGFDESLPPYGCDDLEISWRVQEAGYPLVYVPEAQVDYTFTKSSKLVVKEFRMAKARMAVWVRHPDSSATAPTLLACVKDVVVQGVRLPWRLLRPGNTPRTRWVRWAIDSVGRLAGYWVYQVRGKPADLVETRLN